VIKVAAIGAGRYLTLSLARCSTFVVPLLVLLSIQHSALSTEVVELQYWSDPYQMRTMAEIFEQYHRENPNVKVVIGQSAARDLVADPQRVLCAIVGGDPPDVIFFDRYAIGEWASRGAFLSLSDFVKEDAQAGDPDAIKQENYYQPCWEEAMYGGNLYGVPATTDDRALLYNKDMLVRARLVDENGEAKPPKTWDELRQYASKLSQRPMRGSRRVLEVAGFVPNYGNSWLYIYGWQNGAKFMSDDGRKCLLNDPSVVGGLQFMKSMYDDLGGAGDVEGFQTSFQTDALDPFLTGKIAMKIDGNWVLTGIAQFRPDMNFAVAPAPMPDAKQQPISWLGGWAWVIPKGAKHPREAWKLIRKLASLDSNMEMARIQSRTEAAQGRMYIPLLNANRRVTEALFDKYLRKNPQADPKFAKALQVFVDLLPHSKYRPVTPVGQLLWNAQVQATQNAIYSKGPDEKVCQDALNQETRIVQRELDRIYKPVVGVEVSWTHMVLAYFCLLGLGAAGMLYWFRTRFRGGLQARREAWAGWMFALPWFIGFICFTGGPILCSLVMSFCSYDAMSPSHLVWGRNYTEMFTDDPRFTISLANTAFMIIGVPLGMAFGLGVAMLLDAKVRGMTVYRTLFYLPAIVPGVASALLWLLIFNPNNGILNAAFEYVGLPRLNWLKDVHWSKPSLILQGLWGAGAGMIVWLAGLKEIPTDLYEAAAIDGAGVFQRFRHITLPMLTPYIFFNLVMGLIATFRIFEPAYLMTEGGPQDSTLFYAYALFNQAFRYMHMGYASALAWILFAVIFALTMFQLWSSKRWVHYQGE
jgi:multiple sugar transport system permease protein